MTIENGILRGFFGRGFLKNVRGIYHELECLTSGLNKQFPSIRASKIPEYQRALDAIERYELALKVKLDIINKRKIVYE